MDTVLINQRESPPIDGVFISLGTYRFTPNEPAAVMITTEGTDGYVVVDALQLLPAR
jgi:hypothetical protein